MRSWFRSRLALFVDSLSQVISNILFHFFSCDFVISIFWRPFWVLLNLCLNLSLRGFVCVGKVWRRSERNKSTLLGNVENNEQVIAEIEESAETESEQPLLVEVETESEQPFHDLTVPQSESPENISEVQVLNSPQNIFDGYKLPFRHNRGQPPNRYSADHETSKSKDIVNYRDDQLKIN